MAHKNDVTFGTMFGTPAILGNQQCGLPVAPNALAGCIGFQLLNIAVAHD